MIHATTPEKYHNYPTTLILKHANFFAQVMKSHDVH